VGIVCMIFSTDMLKAFFANKLTVFLSNKAILMINKVAGIILMICSLVLCVRTLISFNIIPFK